jgi:hypothetical protein
MADEKFFNIKGQFICQKCKSDVTAGRFWNESGDVTWMCQSKHISRVELLAKKKKKKDFDNE